MINVFPKKFLQDIWLNLFLFMKKKYLLSLCKMVLLKVDLFTLATQTV